MGNKFDNVTVFETDTIIEALKSIDANKQGFVIVIDNQNVVLGVLTDGDIRRAIIRGFKESELVSEVYTKHAKMVCVSDGLEKVTEFFKNKEIKFLPIVDKENRLVNYITKEQMHALLLQDIHADLNYDFSSIDTSIVDHEIYHRPWGYYKTTVLNDYFQAKVISIKPGGELSLQSHNQREEHWIVVHGTGVVQLDDSKITVTCGSSVFIPKGCKHRLTNTNKKQNLIITEVQIGNYFGEDDIIRYKDKYGRI